MAWKQLEKKIDHFFIYHYKKIKIVINSKNIKAKNSSAQKNLNSIIIYSSSCCSKTICLSFFHLTQEVNPGVMRVNEGCGFKMAKSIIKA